MSSITPSAAVPDDEDEIPELFRPIEEEPPDVAREGFRPRYLLVAAILSSPALVAPFVWAVVLFAGFGALEAWRLASSEGSAVSTVGHFIGALAKSVLKVPPRLVRVALVVAVAAVLGAGATAGVSALTRGDSGAAVVVRTALSWWFPTGLRVALYIAVVIEARQSLQHAVKRRLGDALDSNDKSRLRATDWRTTQAVWMKDSAAALTWLACLVVVVGALNLPARLTPPAAGSLASLAPVEDMRDRIDQTARADVMSTTNEVLRCMLPAGTTASVALSNWGKAAILDVRVDGAVPTRAILAGLDASVSGRVRTIRMPDAVADGRSLGAPPRIEPSDEGWGADDPWTAVARDCAAVNLSTINSFRGVVSTADPAAWSFTATGTRTDRPDAGLLQPPTSVVPPATSVTTSVAAQTTSTTVP